MSQSTRERLIKSAIKVFSEKGFFNAKVSDIVRDAGLAQGTFYLYFRSKEEIFLEIVQMIAGQIFGIIEKYSVYEDRPSRIIKLFGREIFKVLYEYREIAYIFFFQVICAGEEFQKIYFNVSQKIRDFYLKKLSTDTQALLKAEILIGFGKRLVEFDMLMENKSFIHIVSRFEDAVDLILGEHR
ncbi:TetR/AcrR family transcriptional regulator [Persephonella atlantica]|uniref:TetR/AcrR family transcriptional regulator n=1 Tax=Persephonella atlantica TaxID=2699429 RepID=A0ABS1GG15_9AQUI|nr:TetR/AcrR family transcriptional regulator [Persephonella atlantica]MBK3331722.1 TetR/AcrR family transcriptional regulator [Persephonella atlantica]